MNDSYWDTNVVIKEGKEEWERECPDSPYKPSIVFPRRYNRKILEDIREQNWVKELILYHASPKKHETLKTQHDFYGKRKWAAVSCTTDPYYAIAFGLINHRMKESTEITLYKFKGEGVLAEHQIGKRKATNAWDVLFEVTTFRYQVFQVKDYDYNRDYLWIKKVLEGEINTELRSELMEKVKSYLVHPNKINIL